MFVFIVHYREYQSNWFIQFKNGFSSNSIIKMDIKCVILRHHSCFFSEENTFKDIRKPLTLTCYTPDCSCCSPHIENKCACLWITHRSYGQTYPDINIRVLLEYTTILLLIAYIKSLQLALSRAHYYKWRVHL